MPPSGQEGELFLHGLEQLMKKQPGVECLYMTCCGAVQADAQEDRWLKPSCNWNFARTLFQEMSVAFRSDSRCCAPNSSQWTGFIFKDGVDRIAGALAGRGGQWENYGTIRMPLCQVQGLASLAVVPDKNAVHRGLAEKS